MNLKTCILLLLCCVTAFSQHSRMIHEIDSINNLPFEYKIANPEKVLSLVHKSLNNAEKINYTKGIANSCKNLGLLYYYQGDYTKNTSYTIKAIQLYEKMKDYVSLTFIYGEYGYEMKRRDMLQAAYYMNKGIKLGRQYLTETEMEQLYNNYGVLKEMQSDLDSALYFYNRALKCAVAKNDKIAMPYSLNNIASVNILQKNFKSAKNHLDKAYNLRLTTGDRQGIAESLNLYGHYYKSIGNKKEAISYFSKSIAEAQKYGTKFLIQENYHSISQIYEEDNNFKQALQNYKSHISYSDSIHNTEIRKKQAELDIQYKTDEKEKQILIQKAQLASKNSYIVLIVALLVISVMIGFFLYNRQKASLKQLEKEKELQSALLKIETQSRLHHQRLAISRDLHDTIGAQLTFIISALDTLKYSYAPKQDENLTEKLTQLGSFTRGTITELRDTIWAMNRDEILMEDLRVRISNFIEKANLSLQKIDFSFDYSSDKEVKTLSSNEGINIYRIIQEAVNNAIKHSEATRINVEIAQTENAISINIKDNGNGLSADVIEGNGFNNMRKRAAELNAEISFENLEKGFAVNLLAPHKQKIK